MSAVDEILTYKKDPDSDFYALLNCDENSSVRFTLDRLSRANGYGILELRSRKENRRRHLL